MDKNQKTAIKIAEVRGLILSVVLRTKIKVFNYSPRQIKAAVTGFGLADKKAVEKMVRLQLKIPTGMHIGDDTFDGLAILLTHVRSFRPVERKR